MRPLRPLRPQDAAEALAVLIDAVQSQAAALYGGDQVQAWCEHARTAADLPAALARGTGWASVGAAGDLQGDAAAAANLSRGLEGGRDWDVDDAGPFSPAPAAPSPTPSLEAFALRDPADRLSLLYCRGRSCRQGRATALIRAIEQQAASEGVRRLRTEASQLSRPLLERLGWEVEAAEVVQLAGVSFERWRMVRHLEPGPGTGQRPQPENGANAWGGDG